MNIGKLAGRWPLAGDTPRWTEADIGAQTGRVALVTGANSGIGLETARGLARAGARVILACRDEGRGADALADLRRSAPEADLSLELVDLSTLSSVEALAGRVSALEDRLDLLVNNAGIMAVPRRHSPDGIESQLATNHLGHFVLTARLWDLISRTAQSHPEPGPRVVNVSSLAHRHGRFDFDDINLEEPGAYTPMGAYRRSKLANLLFTYELQRRCRGRGNGVMSTAAHPGLTQTRLFVSGDRPFYYTLLRPVIGLVIQQAPMGALPTLRAAVDPEANGGEYYGPAKWGETTGHPVIVASNDRSHDPELACRLWDWSEAAAGIRFSV